MGTGWWGEGRPVIDYDHEQGAINFPALGRAGRSLCPRFFSGSTNGGPAQIDSPSSRFDGGRIDRFPFRGPLQLQEHFFDSVRAKPMSCVSKTLTLFPVAPKDVN